MNKLITVRDLCRTFHLGGQVVRALDHVNLDVNQGDYLAVMGTSGSGKSTLMNVLGCLDTPTSGTYELLEHRVSEMGDNQLSEIRNNYIGFVFQSFHLLPRLNAWDNVLLPLRYSRSGTKRSDGIERARQLTDTLGLSDRLNHRPSELSGGQRQRVAIARALVTSPKLLLADEPTGNLDTKTSNGILDLFDELNKIRKETIVIVTHEDEVASRAKRVIYMRDGKVEESRVNPTLSTARAGVGR